jgi:hypothetical protein
MICGTTSIDQIGKALITLLLAGWADDEIGPTLRAILHGRARTVDTREASARRRGQSHGSLEAGSDERDRLVR